MGENRTDALISKQEGTATPSRWDFIGHLQSRKVRDVVGRVDARPRAVGRVDRRARSTRARERPQDVLVEVNIAADPGK